MSVLEKLACQLYELEGFSREGFEKRYNIARKISGLESPPAEVTIIYPKPLSSKEIRCSADIDSKIYEQTKANIVCTHAPIPITWPRMPFDSCRDEDTYDKFLEASKLGIVYAMILKEKHPNIISVNHLPVLSVYDFGCRFIDDIREANEELTKGKLEIKFEPAANVKGFVEGSYDNFNSFINYFEPAELVLDLDHEAQYIKKDIFEQGMERLSYKFWKDYLGLKFEKERIRVLEKTNKVGLIHIAEPTGFDTRMLISKESLGSIMNLIKKPLVKYLISECVDDTDVLYLKDLKKIEKKRVFPAKAFKFVSALPSTLSSRLIKSYYKRGGEERNKLSLKGYLHTWRILEELLKEER